MEEPVAPFMPPISLMRMVLALCVSGALAMWLYRKLRQWPDLDYGYVGVAVMYMGAVGVIFYAACAIGNPEMAHYQADMRAYAKARQQWHQLHGKAEQVLATRRARELRIVMEELQQSKT